MTNTSWERLGPSLRAVLVFAQRRRWHLLMPLFCGVTLLAVAACARGGSHLYGWYTLQPGMELSSEKDAGSDSQTVLALLYTIATGQEYAIERHMPIEGLRGRPALHLTARATRVLHLAVVLVDEQEREYRCARTLLPGDWRELDFLDFGPGVDDWAQIAAIRLVDRTGALGGQGPVSLKLVGLPL